ncbi:MAG: hypothetical protein AAFO04_29670 [Cyanobacteria bacterium J06592_8]
MGSVKIENHGNIGDDEIQYRLKIDTGHVENTDTPNCVPYTFPIPASLEQEGYILQKLKFDESSRVGNCYINYAIENNVIRLEAVAQAVRDASRLWYKAGGHLKGTVILTFQKIKPETEEIKYEFNVDTGHVENTDLPNRVSYTFPIDFHLLKQSYTVSQFEFSESSRVGNCFIHPTVENGVIKIEAVAQTVRDNAFPMFYKKGGHLKGTVRVTLRKTEYVGVNVSDDIHKTMGEIVNFKEIRGDVFIRIDQLQSIQGDNNRAGQGNNSQFTQGDNNELS